QERQEQPLQADRVSHRGLLGWVHLQGVSDEASSRRGTCEPLRAAYGPLTDCPSKDEREQENEQDRAACDRRNRAPRLRVQNREARCRDREEVSDAQRIAAVRDRELELLQTGISTELRLVDSLLRVLCRVERVGVGLTAPS